MNAAEIVPLSLAALEGIFQSRQHQHEHPGPEKRSAPRWPFPGTVELWFARSDGRETYALGECQNLSLGGVGIRCDRALAPGAELAIAIHQPECSLHGRAVVRHCTKLHHDHFAGLEFIFD